MRKNGNMDRNKYLALDNLKKIAKFDKSVVSWVIMYKFLFMLAILIN